MAKRLETRKDWFFNFESAYEHKDAEQMIQELQNTIPSIQKSLQQATADGDQARASELQHRLKTLQDALVSYQQALPLQQQRREEREQYQKELLEDYGLTSQPKLPSMRKNPGKGVTITPEMAKPYVVQNPEEPQEFEKEEWKDPRKREKDKARKLIKERTKQIIETLKNQGVSDWMDTSTIVDAVMQDPQVKEVLGFEYITEKPDGSESRSTLFGGYEKDVIQKIVEKMKRPGTTRLFDRSRQQDLAEKSKIPGFLTGESMTGDTIEMLGDEPDFDEYKNYVEEIRSSKSNPGLYQQFIEDYGALYRQKKMDPPSYESWLENIRTKTYQDWSIEKDPEYIDFVNREMQIAENAKGSGLTDKEKRNLFSNLGYGAFFKYLDEEGKDGSGVGIRQIGAPPADLNRVRSPESVRDELVEMVQDQGLPTTEENVEQLNNLAEKLWNGEIEKKVADLLIYDPEIKKHLAWNAYKIKEAFNSVDRANRPKDMSVWGFEEALKHNLKQDQTSWLERYKKRMEAIEADPSQKDPSIRGNKEAVILSELKRWIIQRIYEARRNYTKRMIRERNRVDSLDDRMFNAEGERRTGEEPVAPDQYEDLINRMDADLFGQTYSREAAQYVAGSSPQFQNIYDLLYNRDSEFFIGDNDPSPKQIQIAYNSLPSVDRPVSQKTVDNYKAMFITQLSEYVKGKGKKEEQMERVDRLREQTGLRGPVSPAQQRAEKSKQQTKPTKPTKKAPSKQDLLKQRR